MAQSRSTEFELRFVGPQMIVDQPAVMAVDRNRGARAARVEREHHPRRLVGRHHLLELRRLDIGRLHALNDRRPRQVRTDRLPHQRAAAVASDGKGRRDTERPAAVEIAGQRNHLPVILRDLNDLGTRQDRDPRLGGGMTEQDRFEIDLVDPVWRLGRRPPRVGSAGCAVTGRAAGNFDATQLDARCRGPIGAVVGEVFGQTGVAQLCGHAEPTEYLHRARRDVIALDAGRIARAADFGDDDIDPARSQIHCRGEPHRARAHHQHLRPHPLPRLVLPAGARHSGSRCILGKLRL